MVDSNHNLKLQEKINIRLPFCMVALGRISMRDGAGQNMARLNPHHKNAVHLGIDITGGMTCCRGVHSNGGQTRRLVRTMARLHERRKNKESAGV